jgi:hypothetical protein
LDLDFALLKATIRKPMPAQTVIGQKTNSRYIRFGIGMMTVQFRYGSFRGILKNGILISQVKRNIRIAGSMYCNLNVSASKEKERIMFPVSIRLSFTLNQQNCNCSYPEN